MRNDHLKRIGFQVRKLAPRPAWRDAVTRNGAVYSTVPLSCAKIERESEERKRNLFGHPVSPACPGNDPTPDGEEALCAGDRIFPSALLTDRGYESCYALNAFLLRKGAFKAGFETPLTGVVSYPYPTSNRSSNPALKWVF